MEEIIGLLIQLILDEGFGLLIELILEGVIELVIKGPGYVLLSIYNGSAPTKPDGCGVVFVGMAFWSLIAGVIAGLVAIVK